MVFFQKSNLNAILHVGPAVAIPKEVPILRVEARVDVR